MANSSNRVPQTYENGGPLPKNFNFSPVCPTNEQAALLPARSQYGAVEWQTVPMSPGNLRHQYSEKPFDYEDMYMSVPKGTLYDHDFSMNGPTGQGQKKVMVGHFKAWPLTNRHVFEAKDYNSGYFKKPGFISSNEYDYGVVSQPNHLRTHWTGTGI